jgi:hypothetical protein
MVIMGLDLNRFKRKQDQDWLDWLQDDPLPSSLRARMRERAVRDASGPIVRRPGERWSDRTPAQPSEPIDRKVTNQISLNIQVPDLARVKTAVRKVYQFPVTLLRQHKMTSIGVASIVLVGVGAFGIVEFRKQASGTDNEGKGVLSENTETPTFEYSLPKGDEAVVGGNVRYDSEKKVVNFQDSIGTTTITVSQQPLPAGFEKDTQEQVRKLAEGFSATKVLSTANPTAYLGTSVKGPQTVIFSKNNLLVFIQSAKQIDDNDWAEYITNLQ